MGSTKPSILIVDDFAVNRKLLKGLLSREPYLLLESVSGEEALEVASKEELDLVLLDVVLPGIDGYEVCRRLRAQSQHEDVPIVFISIKSEANEKVKGLEVGGNDFLSKPFDGSEVVARVKTHLKVRELTQSLKRTNHHLRDKQRQLEKDLASAALIQRSLLPNCAPDISGLEVTWKFEPSTKVGGDIFNALRLDETHWGFFVADVSGHGISSAMVTVSLSQTLSPQYGNIVKKKTLDHPHHRIKSPVEVFKELDRLYPVDRFDKSFTACYMVYDADTGQLDYSNAAHPPPLLVRPDGSSKKLEAGGSFLGLGIDLVFEQDTVKLEPGDRVYVYTDGLYEIFNSREEEFGLERLNKLLASRDGVDLDELWTKIKAELADFAPGALPRDDITLVCLEAKEE